MIFSFFRFVIRRLIMSPFLFVGYQFLRLLRLR